ncbi:MAG TPA: hypothetical protein VFG09_04475 [Thermodesulfovibrionales bacterium]|nr:hypothetical protein [Thermodesulfovibrionales bacterium]
MLKKVLKAKEKERHKEENLLSLELAEVKDVADLIFRRLEKKIEVLEAIESSVDEKIAILEKLLQQAESVKTPSDSMNRKHEIIALKRRGLKIDEIASILDMPVGEVQLVVNLDGHKA